MGKNTNSDERPVQGVYKQCVKDVQGKCKNVQGMFKDIQGMFKYCESNICNEFAMNLHVVCNGVLCKEKERNKNTLKVKL